VPSRILLSTAPENLYLLLGPSDCIANVLPFEGERIEKLQCELKGTARGCDFDGGTASDPPRVATPLLVLGGVISARASQWTLR
jgi:hypothetical protein